MGKSKPKKITSDLKGLAAREAGLINNDTDGSNARATQPKTGPKAPKNVEKIEELCQLLAQGHSVEASCVGANLARRTLYRWLDEDEELLDRIEDAKLAGEGSILAEMRSHINAKQDWKGLAWILERRWPERYSAKREIEVSTKQANGIPEVMAMLEQTNEMMKDKDDEDC